MDFMTPEQAQRLRLALFDLALGLREATRTLKAYSAKAQTAWHDGISAAIKRREARVAAFNR